MADLSGVLRKTIDGLPRATPQLRAKVYEKARAAIQRQIQVANPPLDEAVSAARLAALEDAIERTEDHYASGEGADGGADAMSVAPPAASNPAPAPPPQAERSPVRPARSEEPPRPARPPAPPASAAPSVTAERRDDAPTSSAAMPKATPPLEQASPAPVPARPVASDPRPQAPYGEVRSDWGQESRSASPLRPAKSEPPFGKPAPGSAGNSGRGIFPGFTKSTEGITAGKEAAEQPFFPLASEEPEGDSRPAEVGAPFLTPTGDAAKESPSDSGKQTRGDRWDSEGRRLPTGIRSDDDFIPEADLSAPRYATTRKRRSSGGSRAMATAIVTVLVVGGLATAGWYYRDQIQSLIMPPDGIDQIASNGAVGNAAPSSAATPTPETSAAGADSAGKNTQTAAAEPAGSGSTREFTQRLLPDGTEVDEGPAKAAPNAFDEGTNIAAASPVAPQVGATPTINSQIGQEPEAVGGVATPSGPSTQAAPATEAANAEAGKAETPPVGQKAVFYQERTQDAAGTQESGNVVWSVVNEPPSDGKPPEPAIRAKVDIPDENMTMTMTIRRNADSTLPASHVIEILFNTPANFPGGGIANVQRLALKATEQARGEPLIGVAGKISDGFFIIALNNLDQAEQSNLTLLKNQQWIDIPIAYATGRRALISIEKGVPGDEAFKQAMDAWAAKT